MTLPNELHPAFFASSGGGGGDLGTPIGQSLRFRGSQNLEWVNTNNSTNTNVTTLSFWMKIADTSVSVNRAIQSYGGSSTYTSYIDFSTGGTSYTNNLSLLTYSGGLLGHTYTDALLRDPSAWYHIMLTTDLTTSPYVKWYINGVQQSVQQSGSVAGGNLWNNNQYNINIGKNAFDGYLAEYHMIDGVNYTVDKFGRLNEEGIWVPKLVEGITYGNNGFYLKFDSSASNGIGHDSSGNGNHFTATGFDTASISTSNPDNDIDYNDTPTNNYTTLNPLDPDSGYTLDKGNLRIQLTTDSNGVRNTQYLTSGKWYWETYVNTISGSNTYFGIERNNAPNGTADQIFLRTNNGSIVVYSWSSPTQTGLTAVAAGDVVAIRLDLDNSQISWYVNNTQLGTTETFATNDGDQWAVFMGNGNTGTLKDLEYNFGQMPFIYSLPSGYKEIKYSNLSTPAITDGGKHFGSIAYTGPISHTTTTTGQTANITGVSFTPDFVWVKNRTNANWHVLVDSSRVQSDGDGYIASNDTSAEQTNLNGSVGGFVSPSSDTASDGGFTVVTGSDSSAKANLTCSDNYNYVGWCWKAGTGKVLNQDGNWNSYVNANTDNGFSIITYDGAGSGMTIGHGLNQAPEFILFKALTSVQGAQNWNVYHANQGATKVGFLNLSNAWTTDSSFMNDTAPTSSIITLGGSNSVSYTGQPFVAYCWAGIENFSKFGSYIGNGSADGPFVYCGFKPSWVLVKGTASGRDWRIYDSARVSINPNNLVLYPNLTAVEATTSHPLDFLSNGFKIRGTFDDINTSSGTYIFAAFAEHPAGGDGIAPATAR